MLQINAAKGIHRIEDAYTNWYLVEDGGRLTVVDCGVPKSWASLEAALRAIDASSSDIEAVVLTHAHFDHIGFAERARSELSVPIFVHENDVPLTQHPHSYSHMRSRVPYLTNRAAVPIMFSLIRSRAFWPSPIKEIVRFSGDTLDVPGSPRVIFTPGHTLGHCAFHFPDREAVIAGDAIVMLDPYTGSRGPQLVAKAATADLERALASLDELAKIEATLLTGHGQPWTNGMSAAIDRAKARPIA